MPRVRGLADFVSLLQQQTEALASVPSTLVALNRSVRLLAVTIERSSDTAMTVNRIALRIERLLDDVEAPIRLLAPGMHRLAEALDDPVIERIPATLRLFETELTPVAQRMRETQLRIEAMAATSERLVTLMDDLGSRLGALPGASLLRRQWRGAAAPTDQT